MSLLILLYSQISLFYPGGIEEFFVPIGYWIFVQKIVVQIMGEKSSRIQESIRMMGMLDSSYWLSYFISDGVLIGFTMSFIACLFTTYGLFNDGNFGEILGILFCFSMSAAPLAFTITAFFDTPQTAGLATLASLLAMYVVYIAADVSTASVSSQGLVCLFPPMVSSFHRF